jgi:hypothetical protein
MHCGKDAVHAATLVTGKFKMSVWVCDDHATTLKGGGK